MTMFEPHEISMLKLGGSLITDKTRPETPRPEVIERLAEEIRRVRDETGMPLIVGHGSGSFGHVAARQFRIHHGIEDAGQIPGVSATQEQAFRLHRLVVTALRRAGVAAYSQVPSSFVVASEGEPSEVWAEPLISALRLELVPVVFGDVVMDRRWGAAICSTEAIFRALVPALGSRGLFVRRVVWLGETDGVYDAGGETIRSLALEDLASIIDSVSGAAGTDVTGGMRHRLETVSALAEQGIASWLGNGLRAGALQAGLSGNADHGTEVRPGR